MESTSFAPACISFDPGGKSLAIPSAYWINKTYKAQWIHHLLWSVRDPMHHHVVCDLFYLHSPRCVNNALGLFDLIRVWTESSQLVITSLLLSLCSLSTCNSHDSQPHWHAHAIWRTPLAFMTSQNIDYWSMRQQYRWLIYKWVPSETIMHLLYMYSIQLYIMVNLPAYSTTYLEYILSSIFHSVKPF